MGQTNEAISVTVSCAKTWFFDQPDAQLKVSASSTAAGYPETRAERLTSASAEARTAPQVHSAALKQE
jgi:hypothetical protein